MKNHVDQDQTALVLRCFFLYLNSSAMLGNYLKQTTSVCEISGCICLCALRVKIETSICKQSYVQIRHFTISTRETELVQE